VLVTAFPDRLHQLAQRGTSILIAIGDDPARYIREFCETIDEREPELNSPADGIEHHAVAWRIGADHAFWLSRPKQEVNHRRHLNSYYSGTLDEEMQFHFRGVDGKLDLPVENLRQFVRIGQGVDDETWQHHLQNRDISEWFEQVIRDEDLTALADQHADQSDAVESRHEIFERIRRKYAPAASE